MLIALLVFFVIIFLFGRLLWNIIRPLWTYMYDSAVSFIHNATGASDEAAKAIISLVAIVLIIILLLG